MQEKIKTLLAEAEAFRAESQEQLEAFRIRLLSKKGLIAELFNDFKSIDPALRKEVGQQLNLLKDRVAEIINLRKEELEQSLATNIDGKGQPDLTMPAVFAPIGSRHPISIVRNRINSIFERIGFVISDGPEMEDDWHNFSALNFPEEHPARDMQDTFFIGKNPDLALRTHTSSVQVRVMESQKPPIRTISPGRVFRNEAISARAHCIFHQVEGLYIDKGVSFADMRQTLLYFAREMFGDKTEIRLRPSFFPFTEPSAEMDVSCSICGGKGCNLCKYTGWIEIMGCGMVDPHVLENCGIDSKVYSGYAFGMGIERITMLTYQIKDLRMFFENDLRFLRQFGAAT
ncbi:MAG TPA: phenylalanine--tRNA ligase subunit alpha [Bacteroidales bacterium]|nr:phenylalanine--tRNA ligase subunit alpha [Bacteroidales bacterium]